MKLNLDIIQDYLPKDYRTRRYGPSNRSCVYSRPLLYESGQTFLDGALYVVRSEILPRTLPPESCGFLAVGARVPHEWLLGGIPLLVIENAGSVLSVFNTVHLLYNDFDQWDAQLRDELEKDLDFDIKRMIYLGSLQLRRNISVMNHTLQNIFRSEIKTYPNGNTEIMVHDTIQPMTVEYGERVKEVCNLERVITVPYLSAIEDNQYQYYCFNLYPLGNFTGCISIGEETGPFREGDFPLMDHFFSYFQKAFLKYLRSYAQEETAGLGALQKLLNQVPLSAKEQMQLSLQPGDRWCCFRLKERRKGKSFPKDYMYATVSAIMPKTVYAVIYQEEIVGLLCLQENGKNETLAFFEQALQRMGYYGGISNPFTDLNYLNDYLRQASYAVEQGGETEEALYYFRDYVLTYMLFACTGELPAESLLSSGLMALREHDSKKGTEYLKTLDLYLQNEMSITKTSQALFIHRSSLLKRLEKIRRLLDSDFTDPNTRLYYRICLALLNMERP